MDSSTPQPQKSSWLFSIIVFLIVLGVMAAVAVYIYQNIVEPTLRLEQEKAKVTTPVVPAPSIQAVTYTKYDNSQHAGNDIKEFKSSKKDEEGLKEATKECDKTPGCVGMTYSKTRDTYYLKKAFDKDFVPNYNTNNTDYFKADTSVNKYRKIENVDYAGNDITRYVPVSKTAKECGEKCDTTAGCQAFNFQKKGEYCYLKKNVTGQESYSRPDLTYYIEQGLVK